MMPAPEQQPPALATPTAIGAAPLLRGAFVLDWIEKRLGVSPAQLRSHRHFGEWVEARVLAAWALRTLGTPWSLSRIARLLGRPEARRNSNSVRYWLQRAAELRASDPDFDQLCADLVADFTSLMESRHVS